MLVTPLERLTLIATGPPGLTREVSRHGDHTSVRVELEARKKLPLRLQGADVCLEVMHPRAAGIDVGNRAHYVDVRPDRDPHSLRRFECFTADLHGQSSPGLEPLDVDLATSLAGAARGSLPTDAAAVVSATVRRHPPRHG
jgi:hypothetical protein